MAANPVSIRLDGKMIRSVERLARQKGVTRSEVLREAVATLLAKESRPPSKLHRRVWVGIIGRVLGGRPDLSERTGEKLRRLLRAPARGGKRR